MPMIDVHLPEALIPEESQPDLGQNLAAALLRWEGNPVAAPYSEHTAVFFHRLPASAVHTAAAARAAAVRVQVTTPPAALSRDGQIGFVEEATRLLAEAAGDDTLPGRTWVVLTEAAEGGWGIAGFALGRAEFDALRKG